MDLYHHLLFGGSIPVTPLFATATDEICFTEEEIGVLVSLRRKRCVASTEFHVLLEVETHFSVLSCEEIRGGLLIPGSLSNKVKQVNTASRSGRTWAYRHEFFDWKPRRRSSGFRFLVVQTLWICARLHAEFFIRKPP